MLRTLLASALGVSACALGNSCQELIHAKSPGMYAKTSVVRALLEGTHLSYGAELATGNPITAETLAANAGISLLLVDGTTTSRMQIRQIHNAIQSSPAVLVAYFNSSDDPEIKPKLDQGLFGAILKNAVNRIQVMGFLNRIYLPPLGNRPVGPSRSTGQLAALKDYVDGNNALMIGGVSIGTPEAVNNLASILTLKDSGLRLVMVERRRLSDQAVAYVERTTKEAGIALGTVADSRAEAMGLFHSGYRHIVLGSDRSALQKALDSFDDILFDPSLEVPLANKHAPQSASGTILRGWLREGKTIPIGFLMTPDPAFARQMSEKFRTLWIDAEHGPFSPDDVRRIVNSVLPGTHVVVRVTRYNDPLIRHYLAYGADGIVCPGIENITQARKFVRAVEDGSKDALKVVMIESPAGVQEVENILRAEGLDVVHLGPYDLAIALQTPMGSPLHTAQMDLIRQAAKAARMPLGGIAQTRSAAYEARKSGMLFVTNKSEPEAAFQVFNDLLKDALVTQEK